LNAARACSVKYVPMLMAAVRVALLIGVLNASCSPA
jgi:hypothetical protein